MTCGRLTDNLLPFDNKREDEALPRLQSDHSGFDYIYLSTWRVLYVQQEQRGHDEAKEM